MSHEILNWEQVVEIRTERAAGIRNSALALKYGVSRPQISKIVNRKCWAKVKAPKRAKK